MKRRPHWNETTWCNEATTTPLLVYEETDGRGDGIQAQTPLHPNIAKSNKGDRSRSVAAEAPNILLSARRYTGREMKIGSRMPLSKGLRVCVFYR